MSDDLREGWYNDPTGRHAERWYIAGRTTSRVHDGAAEAHDPVRASGRPVDPAATREGWYTDPLGRHQSRWFSAGMPTGLVRDGTTASTDPLELDQLQHAAFAPAEPVGWLPEPAGPTTDGRGPVAWWDGWVAAPGESRARWGLDGATGLGLDAGVRAGLRASTSRSPLDTDVRLFTFALIVIALGLASVFVFRPLVGAVLIGSGLLLAGWAVLAGTFDFLRELPARRLQRRASRRGRPSSAALPRPSC